MRNRDVRESGMRNRDTVRDEVLERQGRVLGRSGEWFLAVGAILTVPGIILVVLTSSWAYAIGWALIGLGGGPIVIGLGLLVSALVSRWSARGGSFA